MDFKIGDRIKTRVVIDSENPCGEIYLNAYNYGTVKELHRGSVIVDFRLKEKEYIFFPDEFGGVSVKDLIKISEKEYFVECI
jgi:hypothetical protein